MTAPPIKFCDECVSCTPGFRLAVLYRCVELRKDPTLNTCAHEAVLATSPLYAATGDEPSCKWARQVGGACGLAGDLYEQKPPEPPKPPPEPGFWQRWFERRAASRDERRARGQRPPRPNREPLPACERPVPHVGLNAAHHSFMDRLICSCPGCVAWREATK